MTTTTPPTWLQAEPPLHVDALTELRRFVLRAAPHLVIVLLGTAATAALFGLWRGRRPPQYTSSVVLMVSKGAVDVRGVPVNGGQLLEYVTDVAFAPHRLRQALARFPKWTNAFEEDPTEARMEFEESVKIEVLQDQLVGVYASETSRRPPRISITVQDRNPKRAHEVATVLADLIAGVEIDRDRQQLKAQAENARQALGRVRDELAKATVDMRLAEAKSNANPDDPGLFLDAQRLRKEYEGAHSRAQLAAGRAATLETASAIEARPDDIESQQLHFRIVEPGKVPPQRLEGPARVAAYVTVSLPAAFVVFLLGFGAHWPRLGSVEDAQARGIAFLGAVPGLPAEPVVVHHEGPTRTRAS